MKLTLYLLLVLALVTPHLAFAQESERAAANLASYWANRAQQIRAIRRQQQARMYYRGAPVPRGTFIPPWVAYKKPNEEGKKELELQDLQLWASMDLDKDGKLTVEEFERFSRSPNAIAFVRQMKAHKAVEAWAEKVGMNVEQAKAAMMVGANAQRRQQALSQQYYTRLQTERRRQAIAQRNQQVYQARQMQQNYWSRLGQQYYQAMRRAARRREEL
ncbi:uncharacterized protein LOC143463518 isoform X2 [Clavelina lepadiformis]|uniref:uncharacterized protein LOC143463518 isoform X2 n=1 Tax=Clavelina lepadiformis TaxID=159417 RepID=UPI004041C980